ncbi:MAG TPA: hypothetical protein VFV38_31160, partial [Ktedonobacteraceae bacterium]|nr:hypothetical protein [Ktedonobacteraceae bacterium]
MDRWSGVRARSTPLLPAPTSRCPSCYRALGGRTSSLPLSSSSKKYQRCSRIGNRRDGSDAEATQGAQWDGLACLSGARDQPGQLLVHERA